MAPKGQGLKRVREAPLVPKKWIINSENRYLFRDNMAYSRYIGGVINREIAQCYYFVQSTPIKNPDGSRIEEYIDYWNWRSMVECDTPYTDKLTMLFYTNLRISKNPFICTTYVCGKQINLSFENLAH